MTIRADDDEWYGPTFFGIGSLHPVSAPDDDDPPPAGRLLLPDPEQRRGWREFYVKPNAAPGPRIRPIGFRRPR